MASTVYATPEKCPKCPRVFMTSKHLDIHLEMYHPQNNVYINKATHPCGNEGCGYVFYKYGGQQTHRKTCDKMTPLARCFNPQGELMKKWTAFQHEWYQMEKKFKPKPILANATPEQQAHYDLQLLWGPLFKKDRVEDERPAWYNHETKMLHDNPYCSMPRGHVKNIKPTSVGAHRHRNDTRICNSCYANCLNVDEAEVLRKRKREIEDVKEVVDPNEIVFYRTANCSTFHATRTCYRMQAKASKVTDSSALEMPDDVLEAPRNKLDKTRHPCSACFDKKQKQVKPNRTE